MELPPKEPALLEPPRIVLKYDRPVVWRPTARVPFAFRPFCETKEDALLEAGVIRKSESEFHAPALCVQQHSKIRFCVDYRGLNGNTRTIFSTLPHIEDLFLRLKGAVFLTTFDMTDGYYHIDLEPSSRHKTAFSTYRGFYEWVRVPFGLKNAPVHFNNEVRKVFKDLVFVNTYFDDICIFLRTAEEHLAHLEEVLFLIPITLGLFSQNQPVYLGLNCLRNYNLTSA